MESHGDVMQVEEKSCKRHGRFREKIFPSVVLLQCFRGARIHTRRWKDGAKAPPFARLILDTRLYIQDFRFEYCRQVVSGRCSLASGLAGWLAGWLVGWLAGWLVGWLAGWLVGWLAGWLAGWLVG